MQFKFKNITLTEEEKNAIGQSAPSDSSNHQQTDNVTSPARNNTDSEDRYTELKNEIASVRQEVKHLNDNVDNHLINMKQYFDNLFNLLMDELRSSKNQPSETPQRENEDTARTRVDQPVSSLKDNVYFSNGDNQSNTDFREQIHRKDHTIDLENIEDFRPPQNQPSPIFHQEVVDTEKDHKVADNEDTNFAVPENPPTLDDYPDFTNSQIVALDSVLNDTITPEVQVRNRNPGKYDTSPYIRLPESGSSARHCPIFFSIKHPFATHEDFDVDTVLVNDFLEWVYKNVSSRRVRKSAYTVAKDKMEHPMNFGVVIVDKMDWFNIMVHPGRPWEDEHVDVIMYYLRKKAKYSANISDLYTTTDFCFMPWITNIEKHWRDSNLDMKSISPDHDVGQCIRGFVCLLTPLGRRLTMFLFPSTLANPFIGFLFFFVSSIGVYMCMIRRWEEPYTGKELWNLLKNFQS